MCIILGSISCLEMHGKFSLFVSGQSLSYQPLASAVRGERAGEIFQGKHEIGKRKKMGS